MFMACFLCACAAPQPPAKWKMLVLLTAIFYPINLVRLKHPGPRAESAFSLVDLADFAGVVIVV